MDATLLIEVERRCRTMDFKTATKNISKNCECHSFLLSFPSKIIQSRLEFDVITAMNLADMTPLQIVRISALKRELINVLQNQDS